MRIPHVHEFGDAVLTDADIESRAARYIDVTGVNLEGALDEVEGPVLTSTGDATARTGATQRLEFLNQMGRAGRGNLHAGGELHRPIGAVGCEGGLSGGGHGADFHRRPDAADHRYVGLDDVDHRCR